VNRKQLIVICVNTIFDKTRTSWLTFLSLPLPLLRFFDNIRLVVTVWIDEQWGSGTLWGPFGVFWLNNLLAWVSTVTTVVIRFTFRCAWPPLGVNLVTDLSFCGWITMSAQEYGTMSYLFTNEHTLIGPFAASWTPLFLEFSSTWFICTANRQLVVTFCEQNPMDVPIQNWCMFIQMFE
jgi:hypothetical protein